MTAADRDLGFMEMAYGLAERARGHASPNPLVGAVVVRDGAIAGVGFHEEAGRPHAEVNALRMAGERARGGTIYVTLEPCVHWGRTPPCVDALLTAGLKRAVISAHDPNPLVHRRGAARLRAAGLEVEVGLLAERNARLNEAYVKYITTRVPFVTVKAAASLDGKTATRTGDSKWISAAATREYVHLLRGESDALMVGINTVLRDDPRLTVRHPTWGRKKVTRVVLDSMLRVPPTARLLGTLELGRVIVFGREGAPAGKADALREKGVEVVLIDRPPRQPAGRGLSMRTAASRPCWPSSAAARSPRSSSRAAGGSRRASSSGGWPTGSSSPSPPSSSAAGTPGASSRAGARPWSARP